MKSPLVALDSIDDRREIHCLLERISPAARVAWLRYCCSIATLPHSTVRPGVQPGHGGGLMETKLDWLGLVSNYRVDVQACLARLVRLARSM